MSHDPEPLSLRIRIAELAGELIGTLVAIDMTSQYEDVRERAAKRIRELREEFEEQPKSQKLTEPQ